MGFRDVYFAFFPGYEQELERAVQGCETLLDVGCGPNSPIRSFSHRIEATGVDAYGPAIEQSRKRRIHSNYHKGDIMKIGRDFKRESFDCVLASDLIEHLTKKDGLRLLDMMERIARKKVIVFTPVGFLPQGAHGGNPWQEHKSGWSVEEMRERGYEVYGINGWRPLRGELSAVVLWPELFWIQISNITQLMVRNRPEKAFQMLCVKTL